MTELLNNNDRTQLASWIGKTCHFKLLYKISRDGCSATTFHQKCDNQGPTVTVLYNTNNTVYGGYLSLSWHSQSNYIIDGNAFLFRLKYNGSDGPLKFATNNSVNAGYGHPNYGPTFGGGHDIHTFSGTINSSGKTFALNGYLYGIGTTYNLNGQNVNSITNNSLQVTDLEVYLVKDGPGPGASVDDKPWREPPEWNNEVVLELKQSLENYKPAKETKVEAANILLIGQIGAGKSSFFNSVNSIFRGKITSKACSGSFDHSVTTVYRKYTVKDYSTRKLLNIRLCDTRGFEEEFALDGQEMSFILDGNIPDRHQFNPLVPFTPDKAECVRHPGLQDKIHCVAFVIDGSTIDVIPEKLLKQLKDLQMRMNHRNLPQVVYLTKLDKVCSAVDEDVTKTFQSSSVHQAVNKVADMMGLPRAHVLPVKNYEKETKLKTGVNILVLQALQQTLDFADDFMDEQLDKIMAEKDNREAKDLYLNSWASK